MANGITTAFWSMTINNYDETDLALVQNGYPDYLRELVHQLEEGEEGTPHIQAWIKLQRQQRLSFVKKLFPRGHFKPITSDEYNFHTKNYAQKNDETKRSLAVHKFNDPMNTIESVMKKVIQRMYDEYYETEEIEVARKYSERDMVLEDYKFAKIFVSGTYKQMWKQFGHEMYQCLFQQFENEHTHTHTHTGEKLSRQGGITDAEDRTEDSSQCEGSDGEDEEGEDYDDSSSETDETGTEGTTSDFGEEDD